MRRIRPTRPAASFEHLEDRRLLAGNVTVVFVPSTNSYQITGDNKSNGVVFGVSLANGLGITPLPGTTVNGGAFAPIGGTTGGIHFDMGNGDDTVLVNTPVIEIGVPLSIDTGNGDDIVSISDWQFVNTSVSINTGNGDDSVLLQNVILQSSSLNVNTGNGKDSIAFSGTNSADATSTVDLQTGHGKDGVTGLATLADAGTLTIA